MSGPAWLGRGNKTYHYLCEECQVDVKVYSILSDYLCEECRRKKNAAATDWNKVAEEIV